MPKAVDFASIRMRVPPGSREWNSRSDVVVRTFSTTRTASRGGSAPSASQWSAAAASSIEGLPLLVREAAHHDRGIFAVDEEACSDGLVVYPVAEAVVPPRGPCFSGGAGGAEVCGPAVHHAAGLGVPGARAVGCLGGGADMFVRTRIA
jgi:hypothetical protein